jgi:hypothetical protein
MYREDGGERVLRASRTFNVLSAVVGSDTARAAACTRFFFLRTTSTLYHARSRHTLI